MTDVPSTTDKTRKDWLDVVQIIGSLIGPTLLGIAGLIFSIHSQERDAKLKTAELAMKIVESKQAQNLPELHKWAVDTLSVTAGVAGNPLSTTAQKQLTHFAPLPAIGPPNGILLRLQTAPGPNDILTGQTVDELRTRNRVSLMPHPMAGNPVRRVPNGVYGFTTPDQLNKPAEALLQADPLGRYQVEIHKTQAAVIYVIGFARRTDLSTVQIDLYPTSSALQATDGTVVAIPVNLIVASVPGVFSDKL